jgi:hypothetical protein
MSDTGLIEVLGRMAFEAYCGHVPETEADVSSWWTELSEVTRENWRAAARAVIAKLVSAGYVLVPPVVGKVS